MFLVAGYLVGTFFLKISTNSPPSLPKPSAAVRSLAGKGYLTQSLSLSFFL
ncbi:MAG: hypothetical protein CM15mP12_4670 [Gammaproteobacteria bacterium]|nr:MAG: hypothetical protein CM15mP12_4670 [Gammaproteobacteria bacterium]